MRSTLSLLAIGVFVAGWHGGRDAGDVYFPQRLGADGPHGQVVPVLGPVERERRPGMSAAWQALLELRQGPTPTERALGFEPALALDERPLTIDVRDAAAVVHLADAPDLYGTAAIVYALTSIDGIERVGLRVNGRACCLYRTDGRYDRFAGRSRFRYWTGVPCELRTRPDEVRCRHDDR